MFVVVATGVGSSTMARTVQVNVSTHIWMYAYEGMQDGCRMI